MTDRSRKQPKRPRDLNQRAATAVALVRLDGKEVACAEKLTPGQRRESEKKAAEARWSAKARG